MFHTIINNKLFDNTHNTLQQLITTILAMSRRLPLSRYYCLCFTSFAFKPAAIPSSIGPLAIMVMVCTQPLYIQYIVCSTLLGLATLLSHIFHDSVTVIQYVVYNMQLLGRVGESGVTLFHFENNWISYAPCIIFSNIRVIFKL